MVIIEGTYENGQLHLDSPVTYQQPVRVRVEFLDELSAAVRLPLITDPTERMRRLEASWSEARALTANMRGGTLSNEVLTARNEEQ